MARSLRLAAAVFLLLTAYGPAAALPVVMPSESGLLWRTETIAGDAVTFAHPGFAVEGGLKAVSWSSFASVFFAERGQDGWLTESVTEGSSSTSLAVGADGTPHIISSGSNRISHAWKDGSVWRTENIVSGSSTGRSDVAIGCDVIYAVFRAGGELKFAKNDGTGWSVETMTSNQSGDADLDLSSDCTPHVAYRGASPGGVVHAWKPPAEGWRHEFVASGWSPVLAVDQDDGVHIAFSQGEKLHYATKGAAGWSVELADDRLAARTISIGVDSANRPHISHEQWINTANPNDPCCAHLLYATKRLDGTWFTSTIDLEGEHGGSTVRVGADDVPRIAYFYNEDQLTDGALMEWDIRYAEPVLSVAALG